MKPHNKLQSLSVWIFAAYVSASTQTTFQSGVYKMTREEVSWVIHCVLLDVKVDNLKALRYALGLFNQTNLDFVDCLLVAYHKVLGVEILSFDKKLCANLK